MKQFTVDDINFALYLNDRASTFQHHEIISLILLLKSYNQSLAVAYSLVPKQPNNEYLANKIKEYEATIEQAVKQIYVTISHERIHASVRFDPSLSTRNSFFVKIPGIER